MDFDNFVLLKKYSGSKDKTSSHIDKNIGFSASFHIKRMKTSEYSYRQCRLTEGIILAEVYGIMLSKYKFVQLLLITNSHLMVTLVSMLTSLVFKQLLVNHLFPFNDHFGFYKY